MQRTLKEYIMRRLSTRSLTLLAFGLAVLTLAATALAHDSASWQEVAGESGELGIPVEIDPCEPPTAEELRNYVTAMIAMGLGPYKSSDPPVDELGDPIPGWDGEIPFPTPTECDTQIWDDSDGVVPQTPGCHYEYHDQNGDVCSNKTGAFFGEACLSDDLLVETNPEKNKCHTHAGGIGHPDTFVCSTFCQETTGEVGYCATAENFCSVGTETKDSAYCDCGTCPAYEDGGFNPVDCDTEVCCIYENGAFVTESAADCFLNGGEAHVNYEDCIGVAIF
ncbi:MAG: hypothetical protein AAF657_20240 [Acidobacteriota bacterium]